MEELWATKPIAGQSSRECDWRWLGLGAVAYVPFSQTVLVRSCAMFIPRCVLSIYTRPMLLQPDFRVLYTVLGIFCSYHGPMWQILGPL